MDKLRICRVTFDFSQMYIGVLLIPQKWMEKRVDKIALRDFRGHFEEAQEELFDIAASPIRHLLDIRPSNAHSTG